MRHSGAVATVDEYGGIQVPAAPRRKPAGPKKARKKKVQQSTPEQSKENGGSEEEEAYAVHVPLPASLFQPILGDIDVL